MIAEWSMIWDGNDGRTPDGRLVAILTPSPAVELNDGGAGWECEWKVDAADGAARLAMRAALVYTHVYMSGSARSGVSADRAAQFARVFAEAAAAEVYQAMESP